MVTSQTWLRVRVFSGESEIGFVIPDLMDSTQQKSKNCYYKNKKQDGDQLNLSGLRLYQNGNFSLVSP